MRWIARRASATLIAAVALVAASVLPAVAQDAERATKEVLERYGDRSLAEAWRGSRALESIGDDALPWVRPALASPSPNQRLMAAKTLIALGETEGVESSLAELAKDSSAPKDRRSAALRLLADFSTPTSEEALRAVLDGDGRTDSGLRIAAATSLFAIRSDRDAARAALLPLLEVDDPEAREPAALALARMGLFDGKVKAVLRDLELEPSIEGDQARLLLEQDRLLRGIERRGAAEPPPAAVADEELQQRILTLERELQLQNDRLERAQRGNAFSTNFPLIDDLLERIEGLYADPEQVNRQQLLLAAAKGMVDSLDPFSSFMDPKETKEFYEGISGEYAGIGAQVGIDRETEYLLILRPIYKGPAYEMGLLTDDKITEVEGITTQGKELDEIVKTLKGPPGTPVNIKVYRRGWREPRDFSITRRLIQLDSVRHAMLPGDIGYISLMQFGDTSVEEVQHALDDLDSQGMRGLILDLRYNPGGYLQAAVDIVDDFVSKSELPIVTQKSPSGRFETSQKFPTEGVRGDWPLVVLVNDASASASEIVSGALQDYGRATIVGERTFGKGSVQRLINMSRKINEELGGETTLRLTVQYYYLPSGRSIHSKRGPEGNVIEEGGVLPDVEVKPDLIELWRLEALDKLEEDGVFVEYLDKFFEEHHEAFVKIARDGDGGRTDSYPGFDEHILARNVSNAQVDDIRYRLRSKIRRRVEDELGRQFACDFNEDRQLQGAIVELLKKLESAPGTIPEYETFAKKFEAEKKKL